METISIIIPVYNMEDYLERTIEALLHQKGVQVELILVDDGSTDRSREICEKSAQAHENIKFVSVSNGGSGRARNIGIEMAGTAWVAFCDADDIPAPDMYQKLLCRAQEENADLCICDFFSERDGRDFGFPWENLSFEGEEEIRAYMASMIGNLSDDDTSVPFWGSCCRGVYKREILRAAEVRFPQIPFAEDLPFSLRYALHCRKIAVVRESLYRYTCNLDSAMNAYRKGYRKYMFPSRLLLVQYIQEVIDALPQNEELYTRLHNTERCYYSECIGNACAKAPARTAGDCLKEIKEILQHPNTINAFKTYDAKSLKKGILYFAIKHKCAIPLYLYYHIRLAKRG